MSRYDILVQRMQQGERIIIDGGTGTEVDRRGVPKLEHAWNGGGTLSHPDIVRSIHEDYIRAGAEIIITNTFGTSRNALTDAGAAHLFDTYNRQAVRLAREARDAAGRPDVLIAGGISYWSWTGNHASLPDLSASVVEQSAMMKEEGVDLIVLEMMIDIDKMLVTLEAAQRCGLPVWVGLSSRPNAEGVMCLYNGEPLADAIEALNGKDVPLINIMHTRVEFIDECLDIADTHWSGLVGVYAHSSTEVDGKWVFDDAISPADYAALSHGWLARNVQLIGGCCGIEPRHIAEIRQTLSG